MSKPTYKVILYYKYVKIEDPIELVNWHKVFGEKNGLKGRILIGDEGINGTLGGSEESVNLYIQEMQKDDRFADIDFKDSFYTDIPFPKLKVKYRKEIVTLGLKDDIDMSKERPGTYLTPEQVQELIDSGKKVTFVDARNNYESKIGKFKDAIIPDIENFREFPDFLKSIEDLKDETVIFYCTGGIRCEKATAYAIRQGFKNVYHIKGGIQRYAEKYPKGGFEGSMYVFDDRIAVAFDESEDRKVLTSCEFCGIPSDSYKNCFNAKCNKRIICCDECFAKEEGCCSEECKEIKHPRKVKFRFEKQLQKS